MPNVVSERRASLIGNLSQVKLALTHHSLNTVEGTISTDKDLVFLLDGKKSLDEPDRKKRKGGKNPDSTKCTVKNFGAMVDISKLKNIKRLIVGWRVRSGFVCLSAFVAFSRLDSSQKSGVKTLVPIRPVACCAGTMDLGSTVVRLMA